MVNVNSKYILEVEYITGNSDKIEIIAANEPLFKVNTNRGSYELSYRVLVHNINSWFNSYGTISAIIRFKIISVEPIMEKDIEVIKLDKSPVKENKFPIFIIYLLATVFILVIISLTLYLYT